MISADSERPATNPTEHADLGGAVERLRKCANGVQRTFKGIDMIEVRVMLEAANTLEAQAALIGEMAGALTAVMTLRDRGFTKAVARDLGLEDEAAMSNTWIEIPYQRARAVLAKVTAR